MKAKVAFAVDALAGMGGGERVLLCALELFPDAPIYTMVYNPRVFAHTLIARHPVIPSFINRFPRAYTHYRSYLPVMPFAISQFDLSGYDLIISFNYAVAHGVRKHPGQRQISYTHTPLRYAWRNVRLGRLSWLNQWLANQYFNLFRRWDSQVATRIDQFAAVSRDIAGWIQRAYQRDAEVIYPPVDLERFKPRVPREDFYIIVSRLVAYKRIDIIVEAFSRLKQPLIIVGNGPELAHLQEIAAPNIKFAGFQPDTVVAGLISRARGFVCAAEEDFGIAMVEAQAAGCPVIAYGKGGALETVIEGQTGLFFKEQTTDSLIETVERYENLAPSFCLREIVSNAQRFSRGRFMDEFAAFANQR